MGVFPTRVLPKMFTREASLSSYDTLFQGLFPLQRATCRTLEGVPEKSEPPSQVSMNRVS